MSKKNYTLITTICGAVSSVAIGIVTFLSPVHMVAINSSIVISNTAIADILAQFIEE